MRRIPKQARSKAKVAAIVEAASDQLQQVGYEGLSTADVAKSAGVSVGTLYQFFDNKDDLMQAIAEDHMAKLRSFHNQFLGADAIYVPLEILVGRMVDWLVMHNQEHPTFNQIFNGAWNDGELVGMINDTMGQIIGGLARILKHHVPKLSADEAMLGGTILVSITKGMFGMLESMDAAAHPAIVAQVKRLGLLYFEDLVKRQAL